MSVHITHNLDLISFLNQKCIEQKLLSRQSIIFNDKLEGYKCYQVNSIDILRGKLEIMKEDLPIRDGKIPKILKPYLKKDIKIGLIYKKKILDQTEITQLANTSLHLYKLYNKMMTILSSQDDFIIWFDLNCAKLSDFDKIIDAICNRTNSVCPSCCSTPVYCPHCLYCKFYKSIGELCRKEFIVLVDNDTFETENKFIDITKLDKFEKRIDALAFDPSTPSNPLYQIKNLLEGYGIHMMEKKEDKLWIKEFKQTHYTQDDLSLVWYFTLFGLHDNFYYDTSALIELFKLYSVIHLHFNM